MSLNSYRCPGPNDRIHRSSQNRSWTPFGSRLLLGRQCVPFSFCRCKPNLRSLGGSSRITHNVFLHDLTQVKTPPVPNLWSEEARHVCYCYLPCRERLVWSSARHDLALRRASCTRHWLAIDTVVFYSTLRLFNVASAGGGGIFVLCQVVGLIVRPRCLQ